MSDSNSLWDKVNRFIFLN